MNFALASRFVVLPDGVRDAAVLVSGEKIIDVVSRANVSAEFEVRDVGDHVVMPGLIDVHVHINEPSREEWEGFETATKAAAAGGITTVIDMPLNSMPVTTTPKALEQKLQAAQGKIWVDVAFHAGVIPEHIHYLDALLDAGCVAGKAFMIDSGLGDFPATGKDELCEAMKVLAKYNRPLFAHAELDLGTKNALISAPWTKYKTYLESRPPAWEVAAIKQLIELCEQTGCPVHIVHLSAAEALPYIAEAKAAGLPLTVETAPHYLYFVAETIPDKATQFKCAPPIRSSANQRLLLDALYKGVIDIIATDHSPCPPDLKLLQEGDFKNAWGGIASLQFLLSVIWSILNQNDTYTYVQKLQMLTAWLCATPAKILRLSNKGRIAANCFADLIVFDSYAEYKISQQLIHHKHKITPYLGEKLTGRVVQTYLKGSLVYSQAKFSSDPLGNTVLII